MTRKIEQVRFAESAPKKKRVAAYARVSSGKDAMLHSLSAQVSYYSDYIQKHGWEYAGVYADEALTGTKDNRENFQRLLAECRNGNVDMVITKSISRFPYKQFLGYRKGANSLPEIVPEEAEIIRLIYRMFIAGKTPCYIAKHLTESGIPTPGKKKVWQVSTVESILTNEKYKGDARLQKRFTTDYLTKTMKINEGEVPQYYVENSHPAIIDPEERKKVQEEYQRRKEAVKRTACHSPFAGKVICGDCREQFGPKVWHSNSQYRRVIWQCNHKFKGKEKCSTPHLTEDALKEYTRTALSFLKVYHPILTEEERERRMERIKEATVRLILSAEENKRKKNQ